MPVEQVPQPCEVCGVETTQRCSSCLEAGISLFFCGKDHQKLVWPAHKTVCGPGKAHPFAVVPLTEHELSWALAHLDTEEPGAEWTSLLPQLKGDAYGSSRQQNKSLLLNWVRGEYCRQFAFDPLVVADLLCGVKRDSSYFCPVAAAQQCSLLVISVIMKLSGAEPPYQEKVWFSLLQHKAVISERLLQISFGSEDPLDKERAEACQKRLYDWVRAGAGTAEPNIMRALASFQSNSEKRASRCEQQ
ncbi:hypothetical protein JCM8208_002833 [Rhodotorula glutinis]